MFETALTLNDLLFLAKGAGMTLAVTGVAVTAGSTYTATVSATNNRLGLVYGPNVNLSTGQPIAGAGDAYAGGRLFSTGTQIGGAICQGSASICDANFRFTTAAATPAVPEPATWAMMLVGFGGIGFAMRRRKSKVTTNIAYA